MLSEATRPQSKLLMRLYLLCYERLWNGQDT